MARPFLSDEQAAAQAADLIELAIAVARNVSDSELNRRWKLTRSQAHARLHKRQRHPKVAAFVGDSLTDLEPKVNFQIGAARLALALVEANPKMTLTAAIRLAAQHVRPATVRDGAGNPADNVPARAVTWKELDVSGVRRAVARLMRGAGN